MGKFKIGDKVRVNAKTEDRKKYNGSEFTITHTCGVWGGEDSWGSMDRDKNGWKLKAHGLRWAESDLELVTPIGFEVGKWYLHESYITGAFQILFVGKTHALVTRGNDEWAVSLKNYKKHKEYIPPPPEEWRIVYKEERNGKLDVGTHPFTSDSEARASVWWKSPGAFKTIRVDA